MTGSGLSGSNSVGVGLLEAGDAAGVLDHHALQAQAQPERRDAVGAGVGEGAELALDAADPEAAGHADRVDVAEVPRGARPGWRTRRTGSSDVDLGLVGEATGAQRLGDREVGVRQVDVLADQRDRDLLLGVVHPAQQVVPHGPVHVAERQVEPAYDVGVEALAVQHLGDVVDRRRVGGGDHGLLVDVAHQRDLALDRVGDLAVGAADDGVGLDADLAQRGHGVLGGLGLQLAGRPDVGHQRDVQEEAVVAADVVADLAGGLEERQRLDVADRATDLGDHDVDVVAPHREDAVLDLVGDVRDHLDGVAEVVAAALLGDHVGVDLTGGHVGDLAQVGVEEPLVVPDVEVGLGTVVGDEDLAVLERVHRPGIDVEVGVQLLHRHAETAGPQQAAQTGGREALAEEEATPPVTNTCLVGVPIFTGFHPTREGRLRPNPTHRRRHPKLPASGRGQYGGHLADHDVDAVDGGDVVGDRLLAQRAQVPVHPGGGVAGDHDAGGLRRPGRTAARRGSRRRRRPRAPPAPATRAARRRASQQVGAGQALPDRRGVLRRSVGRREREPDQLAEPRVRRRVGAHRVVAERGHQLAAHGVDQGLLRGVDQHRLGVVRPGDRAPGPLDLGRRGRTRRPRPPPAG